MTGPRCLRVAQKIARDPGLCIVRGHPYFLGLWSRATLSILSGDVVHSGRLVAPLRLSVKLILVIWATNQFWRSFFSSRALWLVPSGPMFLVVIKRYSLIRLFFEIFYEIIIYCPYCRRAVV